MKANSQSVAGSHGSDKVPLCTQTKPVRSLYSCLKDGVERKARCSRRMRAHIPTMPTPLSPPSRGARGANERCSAALLGSDRRATLCHPDPEHDAPQLFVAAGEPESIIELMTTGASAGRPV